MRFKFQRRHDGGFNAYVRDTGQWLGIVDRRNDGWCGFTHTVQIPSHPETNVFGLSRRRDAAIALKAIRDAWEQLHPYQERERAVRESFGY
jgi:hypothetical protein